MDVHSKEPQEPRFLERRIEKKGLRPRYAASIIAFTWLVAIVVFGIVEHLVDPETFDSAWLGMWWATQTVTTVGYGDVVPQGGPGRFIATILMVGGLSLFAVITGTITSAFVARAEARRRDREGDPVQARMDQISAELEAVREQLTRIEVQGSTTSGQ